MKYGVFWDNLGSGIGYDNQLTNFGTGLMRLVNKARVITRQCLLTALDMQNFNHFIPVYDGIESGYYYVNKIANFIPGRPTSVTLVRM